MDIDVNMDTDTETSFSAEADDRFIIYLKKLAKVIVTYFIVNKLKKLINNFQYLSIYCKKLIADKIRVRDM